MIIYKAKTLIDGFRIGPEYQGKKVIAVPKEKVIYSDLQVFYKPTGEYMQLERNQYPLTVINFPDKFGRGTYSLYYYEWMPTQQALL